MTANDEILALIDKGVDDILTAFDVDTPPVPVELMLQRPREGLWQEIDLSEMSATFLNLRDRYAPRMSAVRLLARSVIRSEWGQARGLAQLGEENPDNVNLLARAIIIPRQLLDVMGDDITLDKTTVSLHFEVPEADAELRLADLGIQ